MAPEHEARTRVLYDHEREEPGRRRHAVADWGVLDADARAAAIKVDGVFKAGQTDAFLEAMARVYPVRTRRRDDGTIEISSRD